MLFFCVCRFNLNDAVETYRSNRFLRRICSRGHTSRYDTCCLFLNKQKRITIIRKTIVFLLLGNYVFSFCCHKTRFYQFLIMICCTYHSSRCIYRRCSKHHSTRHSTSPLKSHNGHQYTLMYRYMCIRAPANDIATLSAYII